MYLKVVLFATETISQKVVGYFATLVKTMCTVTVWAKNPRPPNTNEGSFFPTKITKNGNVISAKSDKTPKLKVISKSRKL